MANHWQDLIRQFQAGTVNRARSLLPAIASALAISSPNAHKYNPTTQNKPYWQAMGWRSDGELYLGSYQPLGYSFPGRIVRSDGTWVFLVWLQDLWPGLQAHPHWGCYRRQSANDKWYRVHWNIRPTSIDAGMLDIERTLAEALSWRPV